VPCPAASSQRAGGRPRPEQVRIIMAIKLFVDKRCWHAHPARAAPALRQADPAAVPWLVTSPATMPPLRPVEPGARCRAGPNTPGDNADSVFIPPPVREFGTVR